jgi:hypothetical protein
MAAQSAFLASLMVSNWGGVICSVSPCGMGGKLAPSTGICCANALSAHCCCTGHGGPGAAAYVQENLWKTLQSHDKFDADIKQALGAHLACSHVVGMNGRCYVAVLTAFLKMSSHARADRVSDVLAY